MNTRSFAHALTALALVTAAGCSAGIGDIDDLEANVGDNVTTFEAFEAVTPIDPATGAYLVEGDILIHGREGLRAFFEADVDQPGALTVNRYNSADDVWSSSGKLTISYCVSTSFGSRYDDVVTGVAEAAVAWESAANVMFTYRSDQDGSCTSSNGNVTFSVEPVSGTSYNAAAFFPSWGRSSRRLLIDTGNAWSDGCKSFTGIMKHELGHALGFRHEHIWIGCTSEGTSDTRQVTSYDVNSVMHYAMCGTKGCVDYSLSSNDKSGAASLYGSPNRWHIERWITKAGGYQSTNQWVAGDFNGDGKDDMAMAWSDGGNYSIDVYLSSGSSFTNHRWITKAGGYASTGKWVAGDFNGDGKSDMAMVFSDSGNYSVDVYVSNGSSFSNQRWITKAGGYQSEGQWVAGDFNNDGKDDMAMAFEDGSSGKLSIDAYVSSGSSLSNQRWATQTGGWKSEGKWVAGDFNGDGKDDLGHAFSDNSNIDIDAHLSSGSSFAINRWTTEQGAFPSAGKWAAGDFDGNGKDDIGKTWEDGSSISIDAHVSTGSAFAIQRWDTQDGGWQSTGSFVAGDFDDDGDEEMALVWSDGGNYSIDVHLF